MNLTIAKERRRIKQLISLDQQTDHQLDQHYLDCLEYIRNHLIRFYTRYGQEHGLTTSQVSIRVSRWDIHQWSEAVKHTNMIDWPDEAISRVKAIGASVHIDKKHVMLAIVVLGLIKLTVDSQLTITKRINSDANTEVDRMVSAFGLSKSKRRKAVSIITQTSTRNIWSRNLWNDSDALANDVQALVNRHIKHGMSLHDLDNILSDHANIKQFKPQQSIADRIKQMEFNARRIVRTESSRLIDSVNMSTYMLSGVKYVDWLTEPGACNLCGGIADKSPYAINDAPTIPDDSHPNCRCHKTPAGNSNSSLVFPYKLH